jgi:hypothetical protein
MVTRDGSHVYNGRAWRPVGALEKAGLVTVDWDLVPHADGKYTWRITVTRKEREGSSEAAINVPLVQAPHPADGGQP